MASVDKKDVSNALDEFYGKVIESRFDRIDKKLEEHDRKFNELLTHFDRIYNGLD
jgi:hypothetical protein